VKQLAAVAATVAAAAAVAAYAGTRPDPATQARADGCGRNVAALFRKEEPTWVYVNDADAPADGPPPAPQWVRGVVSANPGWLGSHPAAVDDPVTHDSFDFLINVKPDAPYAYLLGTGNFAGAGEETGRLHTEWEENAFPSFAWPEPGDRVELLGSWVWDCGHWGGGGERTELHPLRAVWVQRQSVSPRSATGESEADLFVSTDKTPAGASADCAHRSKGDRAAFKACLGAEPNRQDVNGAYRFDLVAPPRPSPAAKLRVRVVDAGSSPGAPAVKVVSGAGGPSVVVGVAAPPGRRVVVAKQIFVGWSAAPRPVHLRVRFEQILVRRAMDPGCPPTNPLCASKETTRTGQISRPPGEWILYADVAGVWTRWRLLRPTDGQTLPLGQSVDVYVARGRPWRVFVTGRECDNSSLSAHSILSPPSPCPRSTAEFLDLVGDDSPGAVVDRYGSTRGVDGVHVSNSRLEESSCPRTNSQGCYRLTYRVTTLP
jgi:hypothetical protein